MTHLSIKITLLTIVFFVSAYANSNHFALLLNKSTAQGRFILDQPKLNFEPPPSLEYTQGPIIALFDPEAKDFYGILLQDRERHCFALSQKNILGTFSTNLLSAEDLALFTAQNNHLIYCPVPKYRQAQKRHLRSLGILAATGALLSALGVGLLQKQYTELVTSKENDPTLSIPAEISKDLARSIALILMYIGIDGLMGSNIKSFFLGSTVMAYSYHATEQATLPFVAGLLLCGYSTSTLIRHLNTNAYTKPMNAIEATKKALDIA